MRILLLSFTIVALVAQDGTHSKFAMEFEKRWSKTRKMAVGVAEAMPAEQYAFKPDPPTMTFGEQMLHLVQTNRAFCAGLKDVKVPALPEATEKAAIVKQLGESFDYCSGIIASVTDEQMDKTHKSPDGVLNGRELLLALYVHLAHHRGQAEVYLRIKGIQPPPYVF
ncbi:MAG TPA: DinB family protein [Bryobacteraceae bacterium]|nr:DinB family protein [Bryobacteraceae bacterium]